MSDQPKSEIDKLKDSEKIVLNGLAALERAVVPTLYSNSLAALFNHLKALHRVTLDKIAELEAPDANKEKSK